MVNNSKMTSRRRAAAVTYYGRAGTAIQVWGTRYDADWRAYRLVRHIVRSGGDCRFRPEFFGPASGPDFSHRRSQGQNFQRPNGATDVCRRVDALRRI